jgi:hypothetical protein
MITILGQTTRDYLRLAISMRFVDVVDSRLARSFRYSAASSACFRIVLSSFASFSNR